MEISFWAKIILTIGIILVIIGLIILIFQKIPVLNRLGRLPGDIVYKKGNFTVYFPIATCILISILLTLILSLFRR